MVVIDGKSYQGIELINSEERHLVNPAGWETVDQEYVEKLSPGDYVKLGLEGDGDLKLINLGGERFWVKITEVIEPGRFVGAVQNLLVVYNIRLDNLIEFSAENVLKYIPGPVSIKI